MRATDKYSIYVVDPDTAIRDSVELLLESRHVDVHGFGDGKSFLEQLPPTEHGCLLVESSLPDSSGLALIAKVRKTGSKMPALLLTSSTDPGLAARAADHGVAGIVRKPLRSQQLMDQVEFLRYSEKSR